MESNIEEHMDEFSKFNVTHHDNIDDTKEVHGHTHRHGENEKEHEHHHGHSKIVDNEPIKIFGHLKLKLKASYQLISKSQFIYIEPVSNPKVSEDLRPPIS